MGPAPLQRLGPRADKRIDRFVDVAGAGAVDGEAEGGAGEVEIAIVELALGADEAGGGAQLEPFCHFD